QLGGENVQTISALLDSESGSRIPFRLSMPFQTSFIGSFLRGNGFVVEPEAAALLLQEEPGLLDVLRPYLNGDDLNNELGQLPSRWVVTFHDWPLGRFGQKLPLSNEEIVATVRSLNPSRSEAWFPSLQSVWLDPDSGADESEMIQ